MTGAGSGEAYQANERRERAHQQFLAGAAMAVGMTTAELAQAGAHAHARHQRERMEAATQHDQQEARRLHPRTLVDQGMHAYWQRDPDALQRLLRAADAQIADLRNLLANARN